jgi:hypothetical protein
LSHLPTSVFEGGLLPELRFHIFQLPFLKEAATAALLPLCFASHWVHMKHVVRTVPQELDVFFRAHLLSHWGRLWKRFFGNIGDIILRQQLKSCSLQLPVALGLASNVYRQNANATHFTEGMKD